jgi:hypothetical protein
VRWVTIKMLKGMSATIREVMTLCGRCEDGGALVSQLPLLKARIESAVHELLEEAVEGQVGVLTDVVSIASHIFPILEAMAKARRSAQLILKDDDWVEKVGVAVTELDPGLTSHDVGCLSLKSAEGSGE